MNKGIIYKAVVKGEDEVTYFIKLECCKKEKKTVKNKYKKGNINKQIDYKKEFRSKLNLTYYVGKVLDFELDIANKKIISVTDIMINNNLQNGDKK